MPYHRRTHTGLSALNPSTLLQVAGEPWQAIATPRMLLSSHLLQTMESFLWKHFSKRCEGCLQGAVPLFVLAFLRLHHGLLVRLPRLSMKCFAPLPRMISRVCISLLFPYSSCVCVVCSSGSKGQTSALHRFHQDLCVSFEPVPASKEEQDRDGKGSDEQSDKNSKSYRKLSVSTSNAADEDKTREPSEAKMI